MSDFDEDDTDGLENDVVQPSKTDEDTKTTVEVNDDVDQDEADDDYEVVVEEDNKTVTQNKDTQKFQSNEERLQNRKRKKFRVSKELRRLETQFNDFRRITDQIMSRLDNVDGVVTKTTSENLDNKISEVNTYLQRAKESHTAAVEAGDGKAAQEALDLMFDARDALNELKMRKMSAHRDISGERSAERNTTPKVDTSVQRHFNDFRNDPDFSWYDPAARDTDSRIALAVDNVLVAEGYDPRTAEYWSELKSRIKAHPKLKHHFDETESDMDDEIDDKRTVETKKPTPPTGGRMSQNSPAGKKRIVVSRERAQAMREMGLQPGTKEWNRMAAKYANYDKESKSA